jgi:hypothetical protein
VLEAVFRGQAVFIITALIITTGAGAVAFRLSASRTERPVLVGMWVASLVGALCLTMWSTGGSQVAANCVVNRDVFEPFTTVQGLLNMAMFVPAGLLGTLVTRRVAFPVCVGVALSAVIETAQGAIPAIGRACDTSDLVTNSAGALLGAFCGLLLVRRDSRSLTPWTFRVRPTSISAVGLVAALCAVWATSIHPHSVTATDAVSTASAAQRRAAEKAVSGAFGDHFAIKDVQYASSPDTKHGTLIVALPVGFLQVSWPDSADVTASLDMSDKGAQTGFPVPGVTVRPRTPRQAQDVATAYAREHYPWGLPGSRVEVSGVGDNATLGWMVSWRRYHHGVLMPMRLDVEVDRAGRISQMSVHEAPDVSVPEVIVSKEAAAATASKTMPSCKKVDAGELLAVREHSSWQAVWRVVVSCDSSGAVVNVNAHSGAIQSRETFSRPTVQPVPPQS